VRGGKKVIEKRINEKKRKDDKEGENVLLLHTF
jgi:ASC-1-like (ASCH) protein